VQKLLPWIIRTLVSEREEVRIENNLQPAHHKSLLCEDHRTVDVVVGSVAKENARLVREVKPEILAMLFLEEPDSIAPNRRESIVVWRLTVSRLQDGLGRLIDSGRGDRVENHTVLSHNVPKPRRDILVRHDCLGHAIDVTNAFLGRRSNSLQQISRPKRVTADARDELDISLLRARLFAMRDK
jgi:hypothetical protein